MNKLALLIAIIMGIIIANGCEIFRSSTIGKRTDSWEIENSTFRIRVDKHAEEHGGFNAGAYFIFQSASKDQGNWLRIMVFRHDDPEEPIPQGQVRFVDERIGYVYMGWMYAVTTDRGKTWSVWNAENDLPNWQCCNYNLIQDVSLNPNGMGNMILRPIPGRSGEVPMLRTKDYGRHWDIG
jgi:hypothetical protein